MPKPRKASFEAFESIYGDRLPLSAPEPLVQGIQDQLIAEGLLSKDRIKRALTYHCDSLLYLMAVLTQPYRYGLDGQQGPAVTEAERAYSRERIIQKLAQEKKRERKRYDQYLDQVMATKSANKKRKQLNHEHGVIERKLKKMTNKFNHAQDMYDGLQRKLNSKIQTEKLSHNPPKVLVKKKRVLSKQD